MNKKKKNKNFSSDTVFDIVLMIIVTTFMLMVLYPMIYIVSASFSSGSAVASGRVFLWPVELTLQGYKIVFETDSIWIGYGNSIFYTFLSSIVSVILTMLAAYPLARRNYQGRKFYSIYFLIPMFFSGGLIPTYIVNSSLGLVNNRLGYFIIISGMNIYNMILMRTFFQNSIPNELLEAAKMDGITDAGFLTKVVVPLSKSIFAVIYLYYMVSEWNAYMTPLIYLRNEMLYPLQIVLQKIMLAGRVQAGGDMSATALQQAANSEIMKYSLIVVAAAPMIIIYPFVQKFFEKGIMIGSLKG